MKQKDVLTLAVIAIISGALSFVISSTFLTSSSNRSQQVEVVEKLNTNFERPSNEYFNESAINPTQIIEIGPNESTEPFGEQ
jgi:energy-converting hydrogenase Eha subunit A